MRSGRLKLPAISAIVATYNRAGYLRINLACLAAQNYKGRWQIIVADDGSTDHTPEVISEARSKNGAPEIRHCWHAHRMYRRAFILNQASRQADGDILIFLDSDCIPAEDLLATYAAHSAPNAFYLGGVYYLNQPFSETALQVHRSFVPQEFWTWSAQRLNQKKGTSIRNFKRYWKSRFYNAVKFRRPKIWGGNCAINRDVFEKINGYDENYVGFGQEDSDMRNRLLKGSYRVVPLHTTARVYHLWHPTDMEARIRPGGRVEFNNRQYYSRANLDVVCKNGLRKL